MFNIYDKVRVVDADRRTIKNGFIVSMTDKGARVYSPNLEAPYTDDMAFAEWFPFESKEISIIKNKHQS